MVSESRGDAARPERISALRRLRRKLIPEDEAPESIDAREPAGHFSQIAFIGRAIKLHQPAFFVADDNGVDGEAPEQDERSQPGKPREEGGARADKRVADIKR